MNLDNLLIKLKKECELGKYTDEEVVYFFEYARKLNENQLPVVFDVNHFSSLVGVSLRYLYAVSNDSKHFYVRYKIPKKSGGYRTINEPMYLLKAVQKWIKENILDTLNTSPYSKAYKKGYSIKSNARFHKGMNTLICIDIENYFGNITQYRVYSLFLSLGYSKELSVLLSKLCTLKGVLPQGAPTSPVLSNLITVPLDNDIANIARNFSDDNETVRYTRYADDISISGNNIKSSLIISELNKVLLRHGFSANTSKTRVLGKNNAQVVTGVVVNEKLNTPLKKRKRIRQEIYFIKKFSIENHMENQGICIKVVDYLTSLIGRVEFILYINPKDNEFREYKTYLVDLRKNYFEA